MPSSIPAGAAPAARRGRGPRPERWLALPALALALGAVVLLWSRSEQVYLERGLEQVLRSHMQSVVRLASEGARQASSAEDAISWLQEQRLEDLAPALAQAETPEARALLGEAGGLLVSLRERGPGRFETLYSKLDPEEGEKLTRILEGSEDAGSLRSSLLGELQLVCAFRGEPHERQVDCLDATEQERLRSEAGLGALLREAVGEQVRYVAIQDRAGLLASSPDPGALSAWSEDPVLERARGGEQAFRLVERPGGELFEGLSPFELPDGTTAVLRIGIEAAPALAMLESAARRQQLLLWSLALLLAFSAAGALALWHRERRMARMQLRIDEQEHQRRHWQEVGLLAAEVAHEARNPLSTVKMVAQRLGREFRVEEADRAEYAELVGLLSSESSRVESVVSDFLDLARPLELSLQPVDLGSLLEEILSPLALRARQEGKRLELDAGRGPPLMLDAKRLFQVVVNLVSNALDAVPAGGLVKVRAEVGGESALLTIADDGPGMSAETLTRIEQPFATTKPKGIGLGLALTRRLVEAHGGTLTLRSERGRGTSAEVWLPRSPASAAESDPEGGPVGSKGTERSA